MAKRSFHVIPHEKGWALKEEGRDNPISTFDTQKEAIDDGRNRFTSEDSEDEVNIIVHRRDGRIRERLSYSEPDLRTEVRNTDKATLETEKGEKLQPKDILSVGSRISWPAMLGGVVITLGLYLVLSLLGFA